MKTKVLVPLVAAALLGSMVLGGCVSRKDYDEALAACRRANDEVSKSRADHRLALAEKRQLAEKLKTADAEAKRKDAQLASYRSENQLLKDSLAELKKKIDSLAPIAALPDIRLPQPVDKALREFARTNPQLVEYLPQYGMVKFKADLTFDKGKDFVQVGAKAALAKFVQIVNSPEAATFHVYVAGHTDDIPIRKRATKVRHPNNWYLSVHRAVAVQKVLTDAGLSAKRVGVMGFGEYHPIVANAPNNRGARENRRVEIWIVPPDRYLTSSVAPEVNEK